MNCPQAPKEMVFILDFYLSCPDNRVDREEDGDLKAVKGQTLTIELASLLQEDT